MLICVFLRELLHHSEPLPPPSRSDDHFIHEGPKIQDSRPLVSGDGDIGRVRDVVDSKPFP